MCNIRCEGLLGVAMQSGTVFLSFYLSLSLSLRHEQRSLMSQLSHNDPELFDIYLQSQFQYIDSSRSSVCPLPKRYELQQLNVAVPLVCAIPHKPSLHLQQQALILLTVRRLGVLPMTSHKICCRPTICTKHPVYTPALCDVYFHRMFQTAVPQDINTNFPSLCLWESQ